MYSGNWPSAGGNWLGSALSDCYHIWSNMPHATVITHTRLCATRSRYWHIVTVKPSGLRPLGFTLLLCRPRALQSLRANICCVALGACVIIHGPHVFLQLLWADQQYQFPSVAFMIQYWMWQISCLQLAVTVETSWTPIYSRFNDQHR